MGYANDRCILTLFIVLTGLVHWQLTHQWLMLISVFLEEPVVSVSKHDVNQF